jgi:spore coat protein A, manganese oxidase
MITRRNLIKYGAAATAGLALAARSRPESALAVSGGSSLWVPPTARLAAQSPQIPLAGKAIPKFVDPLPGLGDLGLVDATAGTGPLGSSQIVLNMSEFQAQVLPTAFYAALPAPFSAGTYVWGYLPSGQTSRATYLGPIVLAKRHNPVEFRFVNNLGSAATTNVLAYKYGTDQTLHWADPLNNEANMWNHMAMPPAPGTEGAENYLGPVPACVHLHGGEVPPQLDGGPDAWFTSGAGAYKGHAFYSADGAAATNYSIYRYPNSQEGSPIWFHDHTLGATRLNVYAGLAGGYLVLDPPNDPQNLPWPPVPLIIQDRMFDTNGQLFFPSDTAANLQWAPNPEHPYWVPEFVGDVICVNGKAWPFLQVQRKRYTFLFLNGSNARTYEMFLSDPATNVAPPTMWVIGTDGGYLDAPVPVKKLTMMSGERYLVIVDFAAVPAGTNFVLKNTAKTPFPNGAASPASTTGQIMQFRITGGAVADTSFNPAAPGAKVRQTPMVRLVNPATGAPAAGVTVQKRRQLTLNEVMGMPQNAINPVTGALTAYPGGPLEILVNNTKWNGERINGVMTDPMTGHMMYTFETRPDFTLDGTGKNWLSELPLEGETEIWEIVNLTADAHPIHLHLVQFQLMNRQNFDVKAYNAAYAAAFPGGGYDHMTGQPYPAGVFIPGFGPPLNYNSGNPVALGGNPNVAPFLKGKIAPPLPQEAGWKDTVIMYPGQVSRIAVRWAPTDILAGTAPANTNFPFDPNGGHGYVWHCHIVDHEDNEMMRPDEVTPNPGASRTYVKGVDY